MSGKGKFVVAVLCGLISTEFERCGASFDVSREELEVAMVVAMRDMEGE